MEGIQLILTAGGEQDTGPTVAGLDLLQLQGQAVDIGRQGHGQLDRGPTGVAGDQYGRLG
jgi:hypothetical protein